MKKKNENGKNLKFYGNSWKLKSENFFWLMLICLAFCNFLKKLNRIFLKKWPFEVNTSPSGKNCKIRPICNIFKNPSWSHWARVTQFVNHDPQIESFHKFDSFSLNRFILLWIANYEYIFPFFPQKFP